MCVYQTIALVNQTQGCPSNRHLPVETMAMPTRNLFLALLLACAGLLTTPSASAGLMGKTLQVAYYNNTTIVSNTAVTFTVGSSIEFTSWPTSTFPISTLKLIIDVSDTAISIRNKDETTVQYRSTPPLYIVFTDTTDSIPEFSSDATKTYLSQTITNLTNSDISVTDNNNSIRLLLNDAILPFGSLGGITLQVGFTSTSPTPVPAPAPILLMVSGTFLLSRFNRKRRI